MKPAVNSLSVLCNHPSFEYAAQRCAADLGVALNTDNAQTQYQLIFDASGVRLAATEPKNHGDIWVDFSGGKLAHRRKFGGGKGQLIAKACGLKGSLRPHILDATAGLGQDAFVLASLGCKLTLIERSPVAFALLNDGLARALAHGEQQDPALKEIVGRITLTQRDAIALLQSAKETLADVIHLDPMFPSKQKSAAVNKTMQAFHSLIGTDTDDAELLEAALKKALYRVAVKRPRLAPCIGNHTPSFSLSGKSCRYDIYTLKAMQ